MVVMSPDGSLRHIVSREHTSCPTWSPDSKYIAYVVDDNTLKVVNATGGHAQELTATIGDEELCCPNWQQLTR